SPLPVRTERVTQIPLGHRFTTSWQRLGNNAVAAAQQLDKPHIPQPAAVSSRARATREPGSDKIQQLMIRLSRSLRKYRWLVFTGWLLALVPAVYLALTQSGNLTGGGFDVAGSQSLAVHDQLEELYHDQG